MTKENERAAIHPQRKHEFHRPIPNAFGFQNLLPRLLPDYVIDSSLIRHRNLLHEQIPWQKKSPKKQAVILRAKCNIFGKLKCY
jgi:hypothetical protein